jgi:multisubunit Na+/H+ antiporter MnhE subunit
MQASQRRARRDSLFVNTSVKLLSVKLFACWWIFLLGVYLLLAGAETLPEIVAGAFAAALAASALTAVRHHAKWKCDFHMAWLAPVAAACIDALRACAVMLAADCERPFRKRGRGRTQAVAFNTGNHSPSSNCRRALVLAAVSLAPDSLALEIDRHGHKLVIHHYGPVESGPRNREWPL